MATNTNDYAGATDPEEELRKRIAASLQGDPTSAVSTSSSTSAPLAAAPFDSAPLSNPNNVGVGTGIVGPSRTALPNTTPQAGVQGNGHTYDSAPAGFDQAKWMDPTHDTPKYAVTRIIGQYGNSPDGVRAALPEIQAKYPGTTFNGTDLLSIPGVGNIDVIGNAGGTNNAQWLDQGAAAAPASPVTTSTAGPLEGGPSGGQTMADYIIGLELAGKIRQGDYDYQTGQPVTRTSGGGGGGGSAAPAASTVNPFTQQLRDLIMAQIGDASQPVNEQDASITQPLSAARDEVSRSSDTERSQLAEALYAKGGLNTDAVPRYLQQSSERNATGLSQLRAGLISSQLQQKQSKLQNLLSLALASGDAESARSVQMQIAAVQAELQRQGMGINLAEFSANLNQNAALAGLRG